MMIVIDNNYFHEVNINIRYTPQMCYKYYVLLYASSSVQNVLPVSVVKLNKGNKHVKCVTQPRTNKTDIWTPSFAINVTFVHHN